MLKNYFKIAWRSLRKNSGYSAINIGGLALGIAACVLILQYVAFELSYENFHADKHRIYRVQQDRYDNGVLTTRWAAGAYAVGNDFKEAIPEIEDFVKLTRTGDVVVDKGDDLLKIDEVFYSSKSFFNIFSYPLVSGDPATVFNEPNTAALSESTAKTIFGSTDVVGRSVKFGRDSYRITGVYQDMPVNTQLHPNILLSYSTFRERVLANNNQDPESDPDTWWLSDGCLTYLKLREGVSPELVESKFLPVVEEKAGEDLRTYNSSAVYNLQSLGDIHLYSNYMMEPGPTGDGNTVFLLLGIAFFIVVLAWVNYINLATARALQRAKEVGIRKTVGSQRSQLVFQFFVESLLFNSLALLLALGITAVAIPFFNKMSGQELSLLFLVDTRFWGSLLVLFVLGVLFSGSYPALVLSRFRPVEVLKGKMVSTSQGALLRKGLVVFQFAASLFLLIGTLTVYEQIQYMRKQSLGLQIDQTLVVAPPVTTDSTYLTQMNAFKESLMQYPAISSVAAATTIPGQPVPWNAGGIRLVTEDDAAAKQYRIIGVDYDYIDQFGVQLIAGRAFSEDFGNDASSVIFNRAGLERLGFRNPEDALGKEIEFWGNQYTIVGVSENFNQESLRLPYEPLIFRLIPDIRGYFSIKHSTADISRTIETVRGEWEKFFPGNTYEYFFLDDHFNQQYNADRRFGSVFGLFTGLAILVACLGLFGLASFTTMQRTKEIGIRKVLGASVAGILKLLYKEFALLLVIAFLVAIPIAWYSIDNWLANYAFRIDIHWAYFMIPFVAIGIIAWLTVSYQSLKASLANPVKSLRTE
jgi:putative ABC transport system permease protein